METFILGSLIFIFILQLFAQDGLRTLCLAYKDIDENTYNDWKTKHHAARYV